MSKYSVVVPIFNEQDNVTQLYQEILQVMQQLQEPFEIIFINDGSNDQTRQRLKELKPLTIIDFPRNYGQTAALDAGFKAATGQYVITLDGDGQNPPAEIPKLIKAMQNVPTDVVSGWRFLRHDPILKRVASRCAYFLRNILIHDGIHDSGCSLKIYRGVDLRQLDLYGESHRFIPALLKMQGARISEIKVDHRPRVHGKTKYNWKRGIKGIVDMIGIWFWRKYASRPLHVFGGGGLIISILGLVILFVLFILRLLHSFSLSASIWPLIAVFMVLVGIQLFVSGILADLLVENHFRITNKPYYKISTVTKQ